MALLGLILFLKRDSFNKYLIISFVNNNSDDKNQRIFSTFSAFMHLHPLAPTNLCHIHLQKRSADVAVVSLTLEICDFTLANLSALST